MAFRELESCQAGPVAPERLASILSAYGIPLIPWKVAESEEDAMDAARTLGFPVVVKTAAPNIAHRTEAGGVRLDIRDENGVQSAWRDLSRLHPSVLIQKQAEPGMEWLIGGRRDSQFGPVIVAGPGGIFVEILGETSVRIAPLSSREAGSLLDDCRGSAVLAGVRGQQSLDRKALENLIEHLSWLLSDLPGIRELDLNPVIVHHQGCFVLDWKAFKD
jgi:acetyltransferase